MATIAVMIGTPQRTHLLAAGSEREAAHAAEAVIHRLPRSALPAPLWVQCADEAVTARLNGYLRDLQAERMSMEPADPASETARPRL